MEKTCNYCNLQVVQQFCSKAFRQQHHSHTHLCYHYPYIYIHNSNPRDPSGCMYLVINIQNVFALKRWIVILGQCLYCSIFSLLCRFSDVFHWTPSATCMSCRNTGMLKISVLPTQRKPKKNYRTSRASWSISRSTSCARSTFSHLLKAKNEWFLWMCGHSREEYVVTCAGETEDFRA